jgi:glycosyltransferase involved in cell wall biosynthesis
MLIASKHQRQLTVTVVENASETDKLSLLDEADVLLFLPRYDGSEFDGLGLVPLEANARHRPAVVLRCGGSHYSVLDGVSGFLVEPEGSLVESIGNAAQHAEVAVDGDCAYRWAANFRGELWANRFIQAMFDTTYNFEWPTQL